MISVEHFLVIHLAEAKVGMDQLRSRPWRILDPWLNRRLHSIHNPRSLNVEVYDDRGELKEGG